MQRIESSIALVTGASKGIGRAIAIRLAHDGFDIWLNYHSDHAAASEVAEAIQRLGRSCKLLPFDVSDAASVEASLAPLLSSATPYALVNNAGITRDTVMGLMSDEDWNRVIGVHLGGFFNVTRRIIPLMQRARRGRIINIASISGQAGVPGQVNYSAAKAGIIGATKALARELGKRQILVNAVAPGVISTDMTANLPMEEIIRHIPLGHLGTPEDVASCVSFLCSGQSAYITGQVLAVNGGLYV